MTHARLPLHTPASAVGHADMLRLMAQFGPNVADKVSLLLGFEPLIEDAKSKDPGLPEALTQEPNVEPEPEAPEPQPKPVLPGHFEPWYLKSFQPIEQAAQGVPQWYKDLHPLTREERGADYRKTIPAQIPILPWPTLWPYLRGTLGQWRQTGQVQVNAVIGSLATGRWPRRIPREPRLTWAPECHLILDQNPRLRPFAEDFETLHRMLEKMRGKSGMQVWLAEGIRPIGWQKKDSSDVQGWELPGAGTPVLVLGDLGQYLKNEESLLFWRLLGQRLRSAGCIPLALVPCPRDLWDAELAQIWTMAAWDDHDRLPPGSPRGMARQSPQPIPSEVAQEKREKLAHLLSPAVRVEPGLLRAARLCLEKAEADVGSEFFFWNHPEVRSNPIAATMLPAARTKAQAKFTQFETATCFQFLRVLLSHHAWLSPAILMEERATVRRLLGKEDEDADLYFKRMSRDVSDSRDSLGLYVDRLTERQAPSSWKNMEALTIIWLQRNKQKVMADEIEIPEGMDIEPFRWVLGLEGQTSDWELTWRGEQMHFVEEESVPDQGPLRKGSLLGTLAIQDGFLTYGPDAAGPMRGKLVQQSEVWDFPVDPFLKIRTHEGLWELSKLAKAERPFWMTVLGCDRRGLYGEFEDAKGLRKLYWLPPGPIRVADKKGKILARWVLEQGTWMAEEQFPLFVSRTFVQPEWCDGMGVDEWGIYADLVVKGITQRFLWIWPGTFWMGSLEDEPEREELKVVLGPEYEETRHKVTLTQGFWLGQTTVSQALWQAVMGKNPSHFKGEDLPVEQVSWDDCKKFLGSLNVGREGLELCLPSEAQWEYACRAGTETPFHFGPGITTEQVNYNGNYPLKGSPKGEYREKTVPVQALPGNAWGLLQMHGNVWEWCQDWLAAYAVGALVDPRGPSSGAFRVLRGGSWFGDGGNCRSAIRDGGTPGGRNHDFGFRLAQGQVALQQESKQSQGRTEDGDRPRSNPGGRQKP